MEPTLNETHNVTLAGAGDEVRYLVLARAVGSSPRPPASGRRAAVDHRLAGLTGGDPWW